MPKINVLRAVTCFYPGTIQLPEMKFYSLASEGFTNMEWAVKRNFQALNIIDYRVQLDDIWKDDKPGLQKSYAYDEGHVLIHASFDGETKARAEIIDPRTQPARNVDRFFFNAPVTELTILNYHYTLEQPQNEAAEVIGIDENFEIYKDAFDKAIRAYIRTAQDWTVGPLNSVAAPAYYELSDIYFDIDVPKEEMRAAYLVKKGSGYDFYRSRLSVDGLQTVINARVVLGKEVNDLRLTQSIEDPTSSFFVTEMFTKIYRDIDINKNYKFALLESFTFAEYFVTEYLTNLKLQAGISKSKIDAYEKELGISYKLNIELPLLIKAGDKEKAIIGRVEGVRRRRNKIIHGQANANPVTEQEATDAVEAVLDLYNLIIVPSNPNRH